MFDMVVIATIVIEIMGGGNNCGFKDQILPSLQVIEIFRWCKYSDLCACSCNRSNRTSQR